MENDLIEFKKSEVALIDTISKLELMRAEIVKKSDNMRAELLKAMERYNVKSFDNGSIRFAYAAPTTRTTLDSARLKKEQPQIVAQYQKTSDVKASVRITVRD